MIDKTRPDTWKALNLATYMQANKQVYYKMSMGDKDTFRFAWRALNTPFHLIAPHLGAVGNARQSFCGHSMIQFSPLRIPDEYTLDPLYLPQLEYKPDPVFMHANLLKYSGFSRGSVSSFNQTFVTVQYYKSAVILNGIGVIYDFGGSLCTKLESYEETAKVHAKPIKFEVVEMPFSNLNSEFESIYFDYFNSPI